MAVVLGLATVDAVFTGAWSIPRNDDWAYSRVALELHRTGGLQLVGWHQMLLLGHVAWAQPFLVVLGGSVEVLHIANLVAGAGGLLAAYAVARRRVAPVGALVCTALLALAPGYALLSTQFMTDVTAFAGAALCLAVGMPALRRADRAAPWLLIGAAVLGLAGITSRETAIVAPAALLLVALVDATRRRDMRRAVLVAVLGLLIVIVTLALSQYKGSLPDSDRITTTAPSADTLVGLATSCVSLSLLLLPALLVRGRSVLRQPRWLVGGLVVLVATVGAALAAAVLLGKSLDRGVFAANLITSSGVLGDAVLAGARPPWLPLVAWLLLNLMGLLAFVLAGMLLLKGILALRTPDARRRAAASLLDSDVAVLVALVALSVVLLLARVVMGAYVFERYLWLTALGLLPLLVRGTAVDAPRLRRLPLPVVGTAAMLAVVAALVVTSSNRFDAARWEAAQLAVDNGFPPRDVDAGFEWVGFHSRLPIQPDAPPEGEALQSTWPARFDDARPCAVVSASLPPEGVDVTAIGSVEYGLPFGRHGRLHVLRNNAAC